MIEFIVGALVFMIGALFGAAINAGSRKNNETEVEVRFPPPKP